MRALWVRAGAIAAAMLLACAAVVGQGGSGVTQPKLMPRDADPGWEVVTVRPSDPNETNQSFRVEGRHVLIQRQTVETMLMVAYGLQKNQIANAPEWVKTQSFDADGVPDTEGQPSVQQFQVMVRKLLEQRFGLKTHKEQREMEVYALRVGKDEPKLTPTKSDPNALPSQNVRGGTGERFLQFTNVSMDDFALMMLYEVQRPLVNQTGLTGRYDFNLKFTKDEQAAAAADTNAAPGLFTAVQEQLGLKLDAVKAPAPVLVVDAITRPSAN
ncbi:MAG TPA: TIGR03435 family protein [Acidobacteriaceae bacterium]|nr:TIGR03435 family protein [Acidobacteriaceae bacterium]